MIKTFPEEYHGKFDLVHVRFISYAIEPKDLERAIESVCQIVRRSSFRSHLEAKLRASEIRPWRIFTMVEADAVDSYAVPESSDTRRLVEYTISERIARGLPPG